MSWVSFRLLPYSLAILSLFSRVRNALARVLFYASMSKALPVKRMTGRSISSILAANSSAVSTRDGLTFGSSWLDRNAEVLMSERNDANC